MLHAGSRIAQAVYQPDAPVVRGRLAEPHEAFLPADNARHGARAFAYPWRRPCVFRGTIPLPVINFHMAIIATEAFIPVVIVLVLFGAFKERRWDFIFAIPAYLFLKYVNAWVYMEQFVREVILKKKKLIWFQPERVQF